MKGFLLRLLRRFTSDKRYYQLRYYIKYKRGINFKAPQTFNEKINYLKLYDRNPAYSTLVDKYEVRAYIKSKIGENHLIPMLGIYNHAEEIDFDRLPNQFVIKATHGSSWVIVCKDKSILNVAEARTTIKQWLSQNFYKLWGEWVYKDIPPRIIIEKFLSNPEESALIDYKFYCFNGEPQFIHVDLDRFSKHRRNFYDLEWRRLPFGLCYPQAERDLPKPMMLEYMIQIARTLADGFDLVRVDLYCIERAIYFGELTFYPGNGLEVFDPDEYDYKIGKMLKLNLENPLHP